MGKVLQFSATYIELKIMLVSVVFGYAMRVCLVTLNLPLLRHFVGPGPFEKVYCYGRFSY